MLYQYHTLSGTSSATIGIEDASGSDGLQVAYNDGYAQDGLAVSIAPALGTPLPHTVTVESNQDVTGVNFGNLYNAPGIVTGSVWEDTNGDGLIDNGELPLVDVVVYLDVDESGDLTTGDLQTISSTTGVYQFSVDPGVYDIRAILPATHVQTHPDSGFHDDVSIAGGDLIQGKNFGFKPGTSATISGFKWEDLDADGLWGGGESPLSGWTIYIDANENGDLDAGEVSTVTAGDGSYTFTGLTPGSYVIGEVLQAGWEQTYPDSIIASSLGGASVSSTSQTNSTLQAASSSELLSSNNSVEIDSKNGIAYVYSTDSETPEIQHFIPGQLLVKFKGSSETNAADDLRAMFGATTISATQNLGIELWDIGNNSVEDVMFSLSSDSQIEYAEPNYRLGLDATVPNDPDFSLLWGLDNSGQTGGVADADIDAPEAWDIQTGTDVVIGVIDTGIDYTHPDLVNNMWTNPGEIAGNSIDDDGNGYIDDVYGWDFVNDDNDPYDGHSHGTHVAGTIAGRGDDGQGVAGRQLERPAHGPQVPQRWGLGLLDGRRTGDRICDDDGCEAHQQQLGRRRIFPGALRCDCRGRGCQFAVCGCGR